MQGTLGIYTCRKCRRGLDKSNYSLWLAVTKDPKPLGQGNQTCNKCRMEASNRFSLKEHSPDWMAAAACRGEDPEMWFADVRSNEAWRAAQICSTCPVMAMCATYADSTGSEGIWGGDWYPYGHNVREKGPRSVLEPTVEGLKLASRRGRKSALERGICTKGLHRILSEDDLIVRMRGETVFRRCRMCDMLANTRGQKARREKDGRRGRQKYAVGVECKNGHLLTEATLYFAKVKHRIGGSVVFRDQARCRECSNESAERLRRRRGQSVGRGKWRAKNG